MDPTQTQQTIFLGQSPSKLCKLVTDPSPFEFLFRRMARTAETARRAAELSDRREKKSRGIIDQCKDAMITVDREGTIQSWNPAAQQLFGWPFGKAVYPSIDDVFVCQTPIGGNESHDLWEQLTQPEKLHEWLAIDRKQRKIPVEIWSSLADVDGTVHLLVRDITGRQRKQDRQVQLSKMDSINRLAAGLAHEINTPTQFVGDNTRFLKDAFGDLRSLLKKYEERYEANQSGDSTRPIDDELESLISQVDLDYLDREIPSAIDQSIAGLERISAIVRDMKFYSEPVSGPVEPIDLNQAIKNAITIAQKQWVAIARLETDFDDDLPPVVCNRGELIQAVLNMIVNAAEAIGERWDPSPDPSGLIEVSTCQVADEAEIRITDNGTGIAKEDQSRIFDPFFTTRSVGQGTGQGLAIAFKLIVEQHQGSIEVQSESDVGSTFVIRIPMQSDDLQHQ